MNSNDKQMNRILVMGAGAVGGYFGGCLLKRKGNEVFFIARGNHLKALQDSGLTIRSIHGDFHNRVLASDQASEYQGVPDLILFTVKSYDTDAAIEQIKPIVSESTQILTIQNGLENYDKLVDVFGANRVIKGICRVGAMVEKPGIIKHTSMGNMTIGEPNGKISSRIKWLKNIFDNTDVRCTISDHIDKDVWIKFTWNAIFNMVTAIAKVTIDKLFENEESVHLCTGLYGEITLLAEQYGISFTDEDFRNIVERTREWGAFKTSTYQDRMKGKRLEYETFTGAILRMGKEKNLFLPYNESIYGILKLF